MNVYSTAKLSPKEIRCCDLLMQGMTMQEIADLMFVQLKTAFTYKYRAFNKLCVRNLAELFRLRMNASLDEVPGKPDQWHEGYRQALQEILQRDA